MGSWRSKRYNPGKTLAGGTFKKWFTPITALFGMINQMNTKKDKLVETGRQLPNKKEFNPVGSS
jgi:hypothetical protein